MSITYKEKILRRYRMDPFLARVHLDALKKLLMLYEKNITAPCPLCAVSTCTTCSWDVLMGHVCLSMARVYMHGLEGKRKRQLRYWIKSYEAAVRELFKE